MYKKYSWVLFLLIVISLGFVQDVSAGDPNETFQGEMVKDNPISWIQRNDHYGHLTFTIGGDGDNFGGASCGIHSLAFMFAKAGYTPDHWTSSRSGKKYKEFDWPALAAHEFAMDSNYGWNYSYQSTGAAITEATKGKIKFVSTDYYDSVEAQKQGIIDAWNQGYFMINSGTWNGWSHITSVDFVDSGGDVHILDSGWRYRYIESMDSAYYVMKFKVDGLDIKDAPKFWDGEKMEGGNSGSSDSDNNSSNNSNSDYWNRDKCYRTAVVDYCADMEQWTNELVEYEENVDKGIDDKNKGTDRKNSSWTKKLFNN